MEFRLLGPLEAWHAGEAVVLGGQRQRTVLAALLMRANSSANVGYLAEAVWEKPPVAPESNLRTYVAGLRRVFTAAGENRLVTRPGGYLITVEPGELDLETFRQLARTGDQAWRDSDFGSAAEHFERALSLWRGQPLAGLTPGPVLRAEIARLEDLRLTIAERYAHALVELGRPEAAVSDLRTLLAEHPLREELWAQLMVALHRAGRQAEALDAFADARRHLVTELGLEPGARLQRVQQEILAGEQPQDTEISAWRQLPMDIAEFTGRQAELRTLHALAEPASRTALTVAVIHGMPGVGKTRLAVHFAHQLVDAGRFDEIQLWTDLRGFDADRPPISPAAVLEHFLRLLGVPGQQIPQELESRAALYRSRLADKRALVLLDNAASEEQIRPLLPGTKGSLVLVTSRRNLAGLVGARGVPLDVLPETDAITLLSLIAGDDRVEAEPQAAARTTALCGRLPIALSLAARRLRKRPMWTVKDLATRLETAERRLDQLAPGTREMHALFTMSYQGLPQPQQRMFRLLGLHPGDDFTAESVAALAQCTPEEAEFHLEAMLDEHLVQQITPRRYRFHDLVRPYARDLAQANETGQPVHRLYTWYLYAAESARNVFDPHRGRTFDLHPLPEHSVVPQFAGHDEALAWYESERGTLRAVVKAAAEDGLPEVAWQLAWVLLSFYYRRSHWDDWIATFQIALDATRSLGERRGEGIIWLGLGVAYSDLRQFTTAIDCHQKAQAILEEVDDRRGQAWNLNNLGVVYVYLERLTAAADCFHRGLLLFRETGDRQGEGICLNNLGDTYRRLDRPSNAIGHLEQALSIQQDTGDQRGLQFTLGTLGDIHHDAGNHKQAVRSYEEALAVSQALGDQRTAARMLANLAQTLDADGESASARIRWQEAMTIFDELGDAQADTIRARLG
ncbi:AfsR/SARP family transcriptional regulator [Kibdelosporangium aridum]|uniref:DNA-binding transcriptional activator of the SARP family n=1 Tax=Kibdelosporangium aridum TaxID=2030 RepID=A0A1Y5XXE6_KIBAR|nr:AfsR/SARP family transcriptional regulator [Kibdelosporangium aridum]SMD21108.1 DNA-binding transcriptional activator of the SARP family [Kibdelosporangium aridum]